MAAPTTSLFGWFTREGRLKNEWARALKESNPDRSLQRLLKVCQRLASEPDRYSHLWLSFLDTCVTAERARHMTEPDFQIFQQMGDAAAARSKGGVRAVDIWTRVLQARDARSETRQACQLLARIYSDAGASTDEKSWSAGQLAKRNARGDEHIAVYVDHLKRQTRGTGDPAIVKLLARVCGVDCTSDKATLKRAADVGRAVLASKVGVPGAHRSIGLHALLVLKSGKDAIDALDAALQADGDDVAALEGLLAACVMTGNYSHSRVSAMTKAKKTAPSPEIAGLLQLAVALEWLDSSSTPGPAPCAAADLEKITVRKYAEDHRDAAAGRLHLIEGNARRAGELLFPLSDREADNPRWAYHAAWAAALVSDAAAIARRLSSIRKSPSAWAVAALLVDANPALAEQHDAHSLFDHPSQGFLEVAVARRALARSMAPQNLRWKPGSGPLEESLEGLRTLLGHAVYTSSSRTLESALEVPLFARLPLADRYFWQGVHGLSSGKIEQGRQSLEKAAQLGHGRAPLVLAVHLLKHNQVASARTWLERGAAGRVDLKIQLLRADLNAKEGRGEEAERVLEPLAAKGDGRAGYALGALYWQRADECGRRGDNDRARFYWEQAAGAFNNALHAKVPPPGDCELVSRCADFRARPSTRDAVRAWMRVAHKSNILGARGSESWLAWNAMIAAIWSPPSALTAASATEALNLLDSVGATHDEAAAALAQQLTISVLRTEDAAESEQALRLMAGVRNGNAHPQVARLERLSSTASARLRFSVAASKLRLASTVKEREQLHEYIVRLAKSDAGNGSLALLAAQIQIAAGRPDEAAATLESVRSSSEMEQALCESFIDMIRGQAASRGKLPRVPADASTSMRQACDVLEAVTAFVTGDGNGYQKLLGAMNRGAGQLSAITDPMRLLPALCAQSAREKTVPAVLVEAVRRLEPRAADAAQTTRMARCAAAVGEADLACRWFDLALTKDVDGAGTEEYAAFLAYAAAAASRRGDWPEAARLLRHAVPLCAEAEA